MSNSCLRTCTVVLIYCAVLFAHASLTVSVRDSQLSATRRVRGGNSFSPVKFPYRNHPSLRHAILTDNMRSLLYGLRRKKRMPHHGRSNKIWRTTVTSATEYRTTVPPPLINVNDIESFNCRQKHDCRILKESDAIALDYVEDPISLVRRAAASESTLPTTGATQTISSSETNQFSTSAQNTTDKHWGTRAAAAEFPIIITEIVEIGPQSAEQITLQRRQVSEEPPTTCITISASTEPTTVPGAEAEVATTAEVVQQPPPAETQTVPVETPAEASTPVPTEAPVTAPPATEAPTAPPSEAPPTPDDFGGGKIVMTTANLAAMATTAGALVGAQRPQETAPIDPGKLSQTLDEILESVESLADQKHTANEDFPCQVNGSWISEAGGVRLEISHKGNNTLDVAISEVVGRTKKTPAQGFLSQNSWNITGLIPLEKKSMVILNAVNDNENQLATFIGECKVCHHTETMTGHWLQVRSGRDCNDQKDSFKILGDLWRREILHDLKKQRQRLRLLANQPAQARSSNPSYQESDEIVQSTVEAKGKTKATMDPVTRTTCIVINSVTSK